MRAGTEKKDPQIVFRGGKPSAVILDIDAYQKILERLEDVEDLQMLARMRAKPLIFRKLDSLHDWRIRVGTCRIIYELNEKEKVVKIIRVRHRREVYR